MEIRNGFSLRASVRARWYFAALGCLSLSVHAQSDWGDKIWWKADAGQWVPNYNKSAAFEGTKSTPFTGSGALVVNGAGIVHGPAEWPKARGSGPIPGLNKSAPIDVVARFKPASVGAAFGRLATKVGPLSSALALATFVAEVGFILKADGTLEAVDTTASPSTGEYWKTSNVPIVYGWSPQEVCRKWSSASGYVYIGFDTSARTCTATSGPPNNYPRGVQYTTTTPAPYPCPAGHYPGTSSCTPTAPSIPATAQQLADKVAAKSGWPTSSAIGPAIAESIRRGESIETETGVVSGPASNPVSKTITNNPNGSTTTKTTTNNYTYNGPNVKVTTVTTTINHNPATGETDTTTETTEEEPETTPTDEEEKGACDLYPDALGCAELDEPTEEIPRDEETIDYEEENVFGSGSCPANLTASIATLGQSVTVWDWSKTCELALPLRALVLGLATFAALLIVMPGDNKT